MIIILKDIPTTKHFNGGTKVSCNSYVLEKMTQTK